MNITKNSKAPNSLTPEQVLAWIEAHGLIQAQIARDIGCDKYTVRDVLIGKVKGRRGKAHRMMCALRMKPAPRGHTEFVIPPAPEVISWLDEHGLLTSHDAK